MNNFHQRKRIRLKEFDYSQAGYYFVTICTQGKSKILCEIIGNDAIVVPSAIGIKIIECWDNISKLNDNIKTDLFCLMPNHIHGIIIVENENYDIKIKKEYGFESADRWGHRSLQGVIRDFKSVTTRLYNKLVSDELKNTLWQKSYYDHIIRNESELQNIREYIYNNPQQWQNDEYYV